MGQAVGHRPVHLLDEALNQRIASLSQHFAVVCETINVPYLEVFTPLLHSPLWKEEIASNDGAHPRAAGYALLAQFIHLWSGWHSWFA